MSSQEATHANHSAPQESAEDQTTRDIYGPRCSEPLAVYDPELRSWRMFGVITLWDSTVSLETLPTSGMTVSGKLFRRSPWARHIAGSGSSAWPTPTTQEVEHPDLTLTETGRRMSLDGTTSHSLNLADAVRRWPTPTVNDAKQSYAKHTVFNSLTKAIMWPTPRSNPAMASLITSEIANDPRRFPNLETVVGQRMEVGDGGRLNPMWVEWLMGFPLGWTDLEDSATR